MDRLKESIDKLREDTQSKIQKTISEETFNQLKQEL